MSHPNGNGSDESVRVAEWEIYAGREWFSQLAERNVKVSDDPLDPCNRMITADRLVGEGKEAEALVIYLWCFDHGVAADPAFRGVRDSFLLARIRQLAGALGYRPALTALIERRDACALKMKTGTGTAENAEDYAILQNCFQKDEAGSGDINAENSESRPESPGFVSSASLTEGSFGRPVLQSSPGAPAMTPEQVKGILDEL